MFVRKEARGTEQTQEMLDYIERMAKHLGARKIVGWVVPGTAGAEKSMIVQLKRGMKILGDKITLYKEVC
jgi:hypothetical protein